MIIPNKPGYKSLEEADNQFKPFDCSVGAYAPIEVNKDYIVIDTWYGCNILQSAHNEWCKEIYENIIKHIELK